MLKVGLKNFPHRASFCRRKCGSDSNLGEFNLNDHDGDGGDESGE